MDSHSEIGAYRFVFISVYIYIYVCFFCPLDYTSENWHFEPQNEGLVQVIFLFKKGDFQVSALNFRGDGFFVLSPKKRTTVGGGNSHIFYVHPDPWGFMIQFDWLAHIFGKWVGSTTTYKRWVFCCFRCPPRLVRFFISLKFLQGGRWFSRPPRTGASGGAPGMFGETYWGRLKKMEMFKYYLMHNTPKRNYTLED